MIETVTKSSLGREKFFGLYFLVTVHHWGKTKQELIQDRNLKAVSEAEALEEHHLLASSWLAQTTFLYTPGSPA